ncbi:hypothetical protein ACJX0J_028015, partial [Zea mays]
WNIVGCRPQGTTNILRCSRAARSSSGWSSSGTTMWQRRHTHRGLRTYMLLTPTLNIEAVME